MKALSPLLKCCSEAYRAMTKSRRTAWRPIEKLLPRLEKVRRVGRLERHEWLACCPAHTDRSPSLSIGECSDGTVLLHCWAGCNAEEIVTAVGLQLRDLFPNYAKGSPIRQPSQQAIQLERAIVESARLLTQQGTELSTSDMKRLELARRRLDMLESRK